MTTLPAIARASQSLAARATFVAAVAALWGSAEAVTNYFLWPWGTWWGEPILASAFARTVFYAVVVGAAAAVAFPFLLLIRPQRRWGAAAAAGAAIVFNVGWLVMGFFPKNELGWGAATLDLNRPAPFFGYWAAFLASATVLTFVIATRATPRPGARRAGRWARLGGVGLFIFLVAYHFVAPALAPIPGGPNVLLITLDAWRADAFRPAVMPRLTAFAAEHAAVYRRAYTCAPWTLPAFAALFTGDYPYAYRSWVRPRDEEHIPLGVALRDAGYDTGAVVGNATVDNVTPFAKGFDRFVFWDGTPLGRAIRFYQTNWYCAAVREAFALRRPLEEDTSAPITAYAERFTTKTRRRPYFLWVHYLDPHVPYAPPAGFYNPEDEPFMTRFKERLKKRAAAHHRLYEGECSYLDQLLAPLVARVWSAGNTIIIITTDHGEEFWEHKTYGHGVSVYEPVVHIPLIVAVPGTRPAVNDTPTSHLALAPTILKHAGVPRPATMVGAPLPAGGEEPRFVFVGSGFTARPDYNPPPADAAILGPWKLILPHGDQDAPGEYYNLEEDPGEQAPLRQDERAALLRARLKAWKATFQAPDRRPTQPMDDADPAALRALGYVK